MKNKPTPKRKRVVLRRTQSKKWLRYQRVHTRIQKASRKRNRRK